MPWRQAHTWKRWKDDDIVHYVLLWFDGKSFLENISYNDEESLGEINYCDTETDVEDGNEVNDKDVDGCTVHGIKMLEMNYC